MSVSRGANQTRSTDRTCFSCRTGTDIDEDDYPTAVGGIVLLQGLTTGTAVIFYGLFLLSISLLLTALWRYIAAHRDLLEAGQSEKEAAAISEQVGPNIAFYAIVVLLAIFAPRLPVFGYLLIAVTAVFRVRGDFTQESKAQTDQGYGPGVPRSRDGRTRHLPRSLRGNCRARGAHRIKR